VGIFTEDGFLVAIGTVKSFKGNVRSIKIDRKYATIGRSHDLILIKDDEADDPGSHFNLLKPAPEQVVGVGLGLANLGIGEGMMGFDLEGYYQRAWKNNISWVGRGIFMTASGKAVINNDQLQNRSIKLQMFAAMGGAAYTLFPNRDLSFRGEFSAGFGNVSASSSGDENFKDLVDGRADSGMAFLIKGELAAIYRIGEYRPFASAQLFHMQSSLNYAILAGALFAL
jgi:hypothetical protein